MWKWLADNPGKDKIQWCAMMEALELVYIGYMIMNGGAEQMKVKHIIQKIIKS